MCTWAVLCTVQFSESVIDIFVLSCILPIGGLFVKRAFFPRRDYRRENYCERSSGLMELAQFPLFFSAGIYRL